MGDYNIDLLTVNQNCTTKLINILFCYAFHPHSDSPTRIYCTSETLLVNIFWNSLWSTVNDLLGQIKVKTPNIFPDNERKFDQPEQISNAFKSYFTNIGPNLAAKIDSNICFTRYLKYRCENSLFCTPTHVNEIIDIVCSLKSTKSSGFDEISVSYWFGKKNDFWQFYRDMKKSNLSFEPLWGP